MRTINPGAPVGQLRLDIAPRYGRSIAVNQYFQGALRVMRPHYLDDTGQVYYTVVNPGGGYVGGDTYLLDIEVSEGASCILSTQSATKVYRTPDAVVHQHTDVRLGDGAVLEYLPDQLIVYRGGRYIQDTVVEMVPTASYLAAEIITPGWDPAGGHFKYEDLRLRHEVRISGDPVVVDNLIIRPGPDSSSVESMVSMDGHSHVGTLLVIDQRINQELIDRLRGILTAAMQAAGSPAYQVGISLTPGPGCAVRLLANSTETIQDTIFAVVNELRSLWRGQQEIRLRKY